MIHHYFFNTHLFLCIDLRVLNWNRNGTLPLTPHLLKRPSSVKTETRTSRSPSNLSVCSTDYLLSSLRLSPESARKIAKQKHMEVKSTAKADEVISLLRDYGFTDTHMAKVFSSYHKILSFDAHKTLKPKLDFLAENGISGEDLLQIVSGDPSILTRSLDAVIIPCFNFLNSFIGNTDGVVSLLTTKMGTRVLPYFSASLIANVDTLRRHGVPDSHILKMIGDVDCGFMARDSEQFGEAVREVREMGIDPSSRMFIHGVVTFAGVSKEIRESKLEVFKSFGWTDKEVRALCVKQPKVFTMSKERLEEALEFFMKKLEMRAYDIAKYPAILASSFESRILPRLSVLEILISKGLVNKDYMAWGFKMTEPMFLRRFVYSYLQDIPKLLEIYKQKMGEN